MHLWLVSNVASNSMIANIFSSGSINDCGGQAVVDGENPYSWSILDFYMGERPNTGVT
jgi:hypothetical protein